MKILIRFSLTNKSYKNKYKKFVPEELYNFKVACKLILKLRIAILKIFSKFSILKGACLVKNYLHNATFIDIIGERYFCCVQNLQINRLDNTLDIWFFALVKRDFPGIHHSWRAVRTLGYNVELDRVNSRNRARAGEILWKNNTSLSVCKRGCFAPANKWWLLSYAI